MWLCPLLLAAPAPDDPVMARISSSLRSVVGEDPVQVVIEGDQLREQLEVAGFVVEAEAEGRVQLRVSPAALPGLARMPGVERIREPWRASPKSVISEGYAEVMAQDWHEQGLTGKGLRIGVLDVGFEGLDQLPASERPEQITTDFSRGEPQNWDHGTAVLEVLHDFAPDAEYVLLSFATDVEFCEAAEVLRTEKVDLINASVGFDNVWHADGSSPVTLCADALVDNGVSWFAAAGNENHRYRVGELSYDADGFIAIDGISDFQIPTTVGNFSVVLRWTEPMGEAKQDLDLLATNEDGSPCGQASETQNGKQHPVELIGAFHCSTVVGLRILSEGQAAKIDGLRGFLYSPLGLPSDLRTDTEDLTLPGDAFGVITVGAYESGSDTVFDYSSRGPTNDGRQKPDVAAPSSVSTETYGFMGFEGSSAATPHAAGLGALWMDSSGLQRRPERLKEWMMENARDLGSEGPDMATGAGAVLGVEPPGCACSSSSGLPGWLGLLGFFALGRRR